MAYKDSPYLPACLDSLITQSFKSHIYITTSTPSAYIDDIAKQYGLDLFITETGKGIAHDWNYSFALAKTKYVTLAHQDDFYLQEYTQSCMEASESYENTQICFTDYHESTDEGIRYRTLLLNIKKMMLTTLMPFGDQLSSKFAKKLLLATGCPIPAPSVMYNKENLPGFQFSPEFSINMDWDAWYRLANMQGRFVYVKKDLLTHRIHPDSATTAGLKANTRQDEDLKIFKRFWPDFFAKRLAKIYARSYKSNHTSS